MKNADENEDTSCINLGPAKDSDSEVVVDDAEKATLKMVAQDFPLLPPLSP